MNEQVNNFIEDFEQGLGDKIAELKKPKQKFNRLPKVKITNINPTYTGHIELLDKSIEFDPVYTLFKKQPQTISVVGPIRRYEPSTFEFLYATTTKAWNIHCTLMEVVEVQYATFIQVIVRGFDGWGKHISCEVMIECRTGLTVYELADEIITYLWRNGYIE